MLSAQAGKLVQAKTTELKQSLNKEFRLIHELCLFVLNASQKADLVRATLATLAAYLTWVPLGYVLESNIVELLLKLFGPPATRNLALQCLTEVSRKTSQGTLLLSCRLAAGRPLLDAAAGGRRLVLHS